MNKNIIFKSDCATCLWYLSNMECVAFDKIPKSIWEGKKSHKEKYRGDHGIQWEPKEEPENENL